MRVGYNTACVKFRKDNDAHIKAWSYLNKCKEDGLSYADCIAELIEKLEQLAIAENSGEQNKSVQLTNENVDALIGEMHIVKEDIIKSIQGYFDKTLSGCSIQAETSEKLVEPEQPHDTDESIDMNLMSFVSGMCDGM